ncbi:HAD-IA family hydrolase [Corynebacterium cystitidis]|uniref:HAD-IA family hydrolase n=1 Tax=Corynebacterium cystitidis TaxID=35757 RepID=UPI00211EC85C|nr:HAD-IA family hydrolase [Corynebacterium cystitidis]
MTPPTILLDVDGTLVDSFPGIRAGFLYALDTVGHPHPSEDFIARIPGPPMEHTLASLGLDEKTCQEAFNAYMDYTRGGGWQEAQAFPGVPELLERWRNDGFRLITATSKGEGFARAILQREGLLEHFSFIGAAEEYGTRRSKTDVLQYIFDKVDLDPQRAVMVGDRTHDIAGAAAFGIDTIAVTWGYGDQSEWDTARFTAHTMEELDQLVRSFHAAH